MQVKLGPLRASDGPFALMALDEAIDMAHLQLHFGLCIPTVGIAFEVVVEEALLQIASIVGVKVRPVFDAVCFQPFIF